MTHSTRTKILFLTWEPIHPRQSGGRLASFDLAQILVDLGYRPVVVVLYPELEPSSKTLPLPHDSYELHFMKRRVSRPRRYLQQLARLVGGNAPDFPFYRDPLVATDLRAIYADQAIGAVVFDHLYSTAYIDDLLALNIPLIYRSHNVEHELARRQSWPSPLGQAAQAIWWRLLRKYERGVLTAVTRVAAITDRDRLALQRLSGRTDLGVVSISAAAFADSQEGDEAHRSPGENKLLFVGSTSWGPNFAAIEWFLTEVAPHLKAKDWNLTIISRDYNSSLMAKVRQSEFADRVLFNDAPSPAALKAVYASSDVVILPIVSGSGLRIKAIEAGLRTSAVVATAMAVEGMSLQNGVDCLIAESAADFARAVDRALVDPDLRQDLGKSLQAYVQARHARAVVARQVEASLKDLLVAPDPGN